jgi:threonine dehydrogenase-like Zn-dependent dehydrogenase
MRALVWDGKRAQLVDRPEPRPGPGEVVVRPILAGVCNTDLEITRGYLDFRGVLGHELVGRVEQGSHEWLGARVVSEINFACGICSACRAGLGRHCPSRRVLGIAGADGAFAELVVLPIACLHRVPQDVPDDAAVFAEPLAAAFEILEQVPVDQDTEALVLGDGKLGLLVAQVLRAAGARTRLVGKHQHHLDIARARGIETCLLAEWDRKPALVVVEATGKAEGIALALAAARPRGIVVLKSTVADRVSIDLAPVVIHELTLVGSRCGPFAPALAALASGSVEVRALVSARLPLERGVEALELAARPGTLKVVLELGGA